MPAKKLTPEDRAKIARQMREKWATRNSAKVIDANLEIVPAQNRSAAVFEPGDVPSHNYFHRAAMLSTAQAACFLVLAGAELQRQKKAMQRGQWEPWVEANCEFSIDSAQRYMALANGVRNRALKGALGGEDADFMALLATPGHQLDDAQQRTLLQAVHKLTDGETVQQLYLDFGITKKPKRKGGGDGAKGDKGEAPQEKPADWTQEQWDRYLALSPEMRRAVDLWRPYLDFLHRQIKEDETAIPHLPKAEREELASINRQLGKLIASTK